MNPTTAVTVPLRVIIVEEMISIRQNVEAFVEQQPGFNVIGACSTVDEAIELINSTKPDLLLLDFDIEDGSGFEIFSEINEPCKLIFMAAHSEYALAAFKVGAIDYLVKPFKELDLSDALQKVRNAQPLLPEQIDITAHSYREKEVQDKIALRSQEFVQIVELKEITYLQANNYCTTVFLNAGKKVVITRPLKEYEELLSGRSFLRTHQSYVINELYIDRYHPKEGIIYLKDGTEIPVSSRKKEMVDQYFKKL